MRCPQVQKNVENKTKLGLLPLRILHTVKNTFYQIFFTDNLADFHFYFRKLLHVSTHLIQKKNIKKVTAVYLRIFHIRALLPPQGFKNETQSKTSAF